MRPSDGSAAAPMHPLRRISTSVSRAGAEDLRPTPCLTPVTGPIPATTRPTLCLTPVTAPIPALIPATTRSMRPSMSGRVQAGSVNPASPMVGARLASFVPTPRAPNA